MNTLATSLLLACIGVVLAWLLRRPARKLAGAGPAFCLWLLPLLMAIVAWLPAWHTAAPASSVLLALPVLVVEPSSQTAATSGLSLAQALFGLWAVGCGLMLARLGFHCLRLLRRSQPLPESMRDAIEPHIAGLDSRAIRVHPAGPAVLWLPGCRLLLPPDLQQRFPAAQLKQVMVHERMHLARLDPVWNLLAELTLAALWFFPPAWLARSRFRLDQELACDAAIVRQSPADAGAYARALISSVSTPQQPLAASTPWLSRSQLKERLTMIRHHSRSTLQRRSGYAVLIALLAGTAMAAQAALPAPQASNTSAQTKTSQAITPASTDFSYRIHHPPVYPPNAIKNHHQGTVVLKVLVDTKGVPAKAIVAKSSGYSSLDKAAKKAAMSWRFHPGTKNGKPVQGWTQIPVTFQLKPMHIAKTSHGTVISYLPHRAPRYPKKAYENHHEGTVLLDVLVGPQGNTLKVKLAKSSGYESLDKAATQAVKKWKFYPQVTDHKPVKSWRKIPIKFQMSDENVQASHPASSST